MSKPMASKRRPIHDKKLFNEIKDNVKNNAIVTRSKTQARQQTKIMEDKSDENVLWFDEDGLSAYSSDEEYDKELLRDLERQIEESTNEKHKTNARFRNQQKKTSSSSNEVDSSSSLTHEFSTKFGPESTTDNLEKRQKKVQSNCSFGSQEKQNAVIPETKGIGCNCLSIFVVCLLATAVVACPLYFYPDNEENSNVYVPKCERNDVECVTDNVKRTLKSMKEKYTHQDNDLWQEVYVGIKSIIHQPQKPSIIVLLGDKTDPIDCLAVLLGNVSSNALDSGLLQLTPEKFENDMGSVITSLRSIIKNKKAVIVWDLLNINEEALKAFHNLCDRINPLVEEVIYIITIIADDYDKTSDPLKFVEKKLYKKLSGKMKEDAIQPLITRITDGPILTVKPEPDLTDCPLPKVTK